MLKLSFLDYPFVCFQDTHLQWPRGGPQAIADALVCGLSKPITPNQNPKTQTDLWCTGTRLQWPRGGPQAIADALVCGLSKHGGKLLLNCHVQQILQGPEGQAAGVVLKDGSVIRARNAVVSNASTWDTLKLMPQGAQLQQFERQVSLQTLSTCYCRA
jgi:phytoene dehydrogenase-like protein